MAEPRYDANRWPLFCIYLPGTPLSEREFIAYLDTIDAQFLKGERFAVMIDARIAPPLTPKERQATAERARATCVRYPDLMVGLAVVLSSPVQRGVFTAIQWISRRAHTVRAYATLTEAEAWLWSSLASHRQAKTQ